MEDYELTPCVVIRNAKNDSESIHHQNPAAAISDYAHVNTITASQDQASSGSTSSSNFSSTPSIVNVRRSNRQAKPPLWHSNYVLPKNRVAGQCLYPIADVVDYCIQVNEILLLLHCYLSFVCSITELHTASAFGDGLHH
ncbi:hypothetical protein H5410_058043 [Solanum commersonii]|uniref:Uncharacterized protein n=1 Tax=Solanum commersonii TaxID=4109 RepID=A0A9J5WRH6_SOLCO|nr:hypothetical protein H5410_058043 [Solanum commersonii]